MKKILFLFAASAFVMSCGNNNADTNAGTATSTDTATTTAAPATEPAAPAADADADKGMSLVAQSDCLTCHKIEEKVVGPAYRDVAKKYENTAANVDSLASKIIHGGSGVWGQLAMSPHPALSTDDAKLMVKYILSLK